MYLRPRIITRHAAEAQTIPVTPPRPTTPPATARGGRKLSNGLVALSSAAVLTVYSAGYLRTRAAAQRLEAAAERPRVVIPSAPLTPGPDSAVAPPVTPDPPVAPAPTAQSTATANSAPADPVPTAVVATPKPKKAPATTPAAAKAEAAAPKPASAQMPAPATAPAASPSPAPAASVPTVADEPPATQAPQSQWKDGTFYGWGSSRHGDIQAAVVIEGGKIVSATIAQCWTRYSCSWIAHLQGQVVTRQSPEVDYVSGATQSTNAFYYAVVEALSKAK